MKHTIIEAVKNELQKASELIDKPYHIKQKYINSSGHPRYPDTNLKLDAIKRCFSLGEGVEYVSREIGYSRMSIYSWYRKYQKYGVAGLMSSKKIQFIQV